MTNPLVSIIVPVYNAQNSVARCLESICSQTYQELEIIVLNDGSTDDSLAICEQFRAKDPRIVVVDKENEGVSRTRKGRSSNRAASIVSPRKNSARLPQKIAPLSASVSSMNTRPSGRSIRLFSCASSHSLTRGTPCPFSFCAMEMPTASTSPFVSSVMTLAFQNVAYPKVSPLSCKKAALSLCTSVISGCFIVLVICIAEAVSTTPAQT